MKNQEKIINYLNNIENPYILKVGDMVVEIEYSDIKKTFNECMINILKQKKKMGWQSTKVTLKLMWKNIKQIKNK